MKIIETKPRKKRGKKTTRKSSMSRVIFRMSNGELRYATHHGKVLLWEACEILALRENINQFGNGAFTADFQKYDVDVESLKMRYPFKKIFKIAAVKVENAALPLRKDVIR